ncbi:MAG: hypothetical protein H7A45_07180 [Verrucomicrobiales bacterium]|nr:hypothetical protein [Verrucomicrobiales bacterium]MCP5527391.1 hypothetical protein [Verrucomicrobiales bacterium]
MPVALGMYARDHHGWFPRARATSIMSLANLWPDYLANAGHLAGISGDTQETLRRLEAGIPLDDEASSWAHWAGFRIDDDP